MLCTPSGLLNTFCVAKGKQMSVFLGQCLLLQIHVDAPLFFQVMQFFVFFLKAHLILIHILKTSLTIFDCIKKKTLRK